MSMFINNCRKLTLPSAQLLRSSLIASQILNRHASYESKKFPEYDVIYFLDTIRTVSILNRLKYRATITSAICMSASYGLEMMDIFPINTIASVTLSGITICAFFHSIGFFCNNVVGFIYANKDANELVISYVSYWGKRVDIRTPLNNINCIEPTNKFFISTFNTINVISPKLSLKLYTTGKILDDKKYYKLWI